MDIKVNLIVWVCVLTVGWFVASPLGINYFYIAMLATSIPAQIGYGIYKSIFTVDRKFREQAKFEIIYAIASFLLLACSVIRFGIPGLVVASVFSALTKTIIVACVTSRYWPKGILPIVPPTSATVAGQDSFFRAGVHSILRNSFMNVAGQADILLLGMARGTEAVGLYKAAKTIAAIPVRASAPIWIVMRPRIMHAVRSKDISQLRKVVLLPAMILMVIGLLLSILVRCMDINPLAIAFGEEYVPATAAFWWLILGTWIFGAASGWIGFASVISERKFYGTSVYFVLVTSIAFGAYIYDLEGPTDMARIMGTSYIVSAVLGWTIYMRRGAW